jgi:hypothetical protein
MAFLSAGERLGELQFLVGEQGCATLGNLRNVFPYLFQFIAVEAGQFFCL